MFKQQYRPFFSFRAFKCVDFWAHCPSPPKKSRCGVQRNSFSALVRIVVLSILSEFRFYAWQL